MNKLYAPTTSGISELEKANQNRVRELAGECMVLLENRGVLPLNPKEKKIALFGRGARHTIKGGTGSGSVNTRSDVNVYEGLKAAGFSILTEKLLDEYDRKVKKAEADYEVFLREEAKRTGLSNVAVLFDHPYEDPDFIELDDRNTPKKADVAIYVLTRNSGEGKDRNFTRGDYLPTQIEESNIRFLTAKYEKVILLLNIGGLIDPKFFKGNKALGAVLLMGQLGNMTGHIVADVLKGTQIPSGRLVDTWAANYAEYPSSETFAKNNGNLDDEYYEEGVFVGYRYFDSFGIEPVYPFGYGLSYTTFEYSNIVAENDGDEIIVRVTVKNTGDKFSGKEVVQLYSSSPWKGSPFQDLRAFAKTRMLAPGETQLVTLSFKAEGLSHFDQEKGAWFLEAGEYALRLGHHSRDTKVVGVVTITESIMTEKIRHMFSDSDPVKEKYVIGTATEVPGADEDRTWASDVVIASARITPKSIKYSKSNKVLEDRFPDRKLTIADVVNLDATDEDLVAQLSVEEMANIVVGTLRAEDNHGNMVGMVYNHVPGAAAETCEKYLEDRGIEALVLADGPAGLRLTPHFKATKDEKVLPGGEIFGVDVTPFPKDTPIDAVDHYQYCTAIPIATTLASSWNMHLIEEMGDMVGAEMEKYHVHLWLAPGMNIHRNPLCGRNFEYYSEDPFLTALCATADTKGVQSHPGCGVTIKHFCCNNQEDNRCYTNAHVSERALREIYLKGFELCVKWSKPYAIMTSYNILNGIHTAEDKDLIQYTLRDEWGFDGIVMTDWYSSQNTYRIDGITDQKYTWASDVGCVQAGNDLQMPGSTENVNNIINAVRDGKLLLADLQFCCLNVIKTIIKCTKNG